MKNTLPFHLLSPLLLMLMQAYLVGLIGLASLRGMKLLKRPFSATDNPEILLAGTILAGLFLVASGDFYGVWQAARFFADRPGFFPKELLAFWLQALLVLLPVTLLYIGLQVVHLQVVWRREERVLTMPVSVLLAAAAVGLALVLWMTVKEMIDSIAPRIIQFE